MKHEHEKNDDCRDKCGDIASERLRYFTGRHMSARDFRDEQAYHRTRRLLHNRMLHGWGVVCGLHVQAHPNPQCRTKHVQVTCGLALDCCGREIPIAKDEVPPPIPWDERPHGSGDEQRYPLLCLEYFETETECVPVLYSEQHCDPQRREESRVREGYRFAWHWIRRSELPEFHWKTRGGKCGDDESGCPEDDCEGGGGSQQQCCLQPDCPPDHCVPLAWIKSEPDQPIDRRDIRMLGRPTVENAPQPLTHICWTNWEHGRTVTRDQVAKVLRKLRVRFDRRLHPERNGIGPFTFVVQFGGGYEDLDFVVSCDKPEVHNGCEAVFEMDDRRRHQGEAAFAYLENQTVFITLKCDFILDCHGEPVDGNHVGGVLPTGDGVRGGTFESWFHVVSDKHDVKQEPYGQQAEEYSS